jgi:ATP-dependent Clp protease ATP-binding subunit ClpB
MAYSPELKNAMEIASSIAKEYSHGSWGPAHLLKALLHNDIGLASLLSSHNKDIHYLREWAEVRLESYPKSTRPGSDPQQDKEADKIFDVADLVKFQLGKDFTDPLCMLTALLKPGLAFSTEQLKSFPVTQQEALLFEPASNNTSAAASTAAPEGVPNRPSSTGGALDKYCTNRTDAASLAKTDPIVGREKEMRMIIEVFGRRTKPNVILVGEPGVGKTALAVGLAQKIQNDSVPAYLKGSSIFELNIGALVAGASYKGEIEDRINKVLAEIKKYNKAILFIDEIHMMLDNKGSLQGIANLLKPELARGEITVIGATTQEEYQKYVEQDEAFSRRFEVITVDEPDVETAIRMLQSVMPLYEKHHSITVNTDAIREAVYMSKRYIKERRLPDAAIDLLDRTMASVKTMDGTVQKDLAILQGYLAPIRDMKNNKAQQDEYMWLYQQFRNTINPMLFSQINDGDTEMEKMESADQMRNFIENSVKSLNSISAQKKDFIDKHDIASVMASKTGIPLGKIKRNERDKLMGMEEILKKRVVGQDHAVHALSESIMESRSGLIKGGQPIGSFFLLGPTGTGKTELAKALADFLFNDESFLIRFDMSEFKEEHSAALLYGAPPGYVGYEEGGLLVNKIRQKPYSVVLFDEIEKAHPSVFDLFLQIMDEGKIHDRLGKEGDFSNAVILFTSNIGSDFVSSKFENKEIPSTPEMMEVMSQYFRPEYLARLTEIVPFAPISEDNLVKIFDIHLKELIQLLTKQGITLEISPEAKKHIAFEGFTPKYGVRPLKGVIRNKLRRPISRMIILEEVKKGSVIKIGCEKDGTLAWNTHSEEGPVQSVDEKEKQLIRDLE